MKAGMDNNKRLDAVEQLLRETHSAPLSPDFKRGVMDAIGKLPAPELLATPRSPRWLAASAALVLLLGITALSLPYGSAALAAWQLDLAQTSLMLTVDGSVVSASLLSVVSFAIGMLAIVGAGVYGVKHRLVGA